jgi:hypothetical protein
MHWQIGNGETTTIRGEKWVFLPSTFSIQSPHRLLNSNEKVSALIDRDIKWWNKDLIEAKFFPHDVKAILSIPLSCTNQSDVIIWRGTSKGLFTVKSAYHLMKAMEL